MSEGLRRPEGKQGVRPSVVPVEVSRSEVAHV